MKNILKITGLLTILGAAEAHAANFAVITNPPNLLNLAVMVIAAVGVVGSLKVMSLVRGGSFGKIWQLFVGGFALLALGQLASILNVVELVAIPTIIGPILIVAATALFLYGIWEAKKVLG